MQVRQVELTIRAPGQPDRVVVLPRGSAVAGRADDADVILPDLGVSRRHLRIDVAADGVSVEDLGSGNGTWFGAQRVTRQVVGDGEEVRVEPFVLRFRVEREAPPPRLVPMATPARLEMTAPAEFAGQSFLLPPTATLTLGRAETNEIILPEPSASRVHAEIRGSAGTWTLRDRNSSNGTFVNGERVTERILAEGDTVRVGTVELRFTRTLAAAVEDDGDRTENFDGVMADGADGRPSPTIVPQNELGPAAPARLPPSTTLSPPPPARPAASRPAPPPPPASTTRDVLAEARGEPVRPEPVRPEPVRPEPVRPEPVRPEPRRAGPPPAEPPRFDLGRAPEPAPARGGMPDFKPGRIEAGGADELPPRREEPGFFSHPVNQVSLGVVIVALCLLGAKLVSDVIYAVRPTSLAAVAPQVVAEDEPAAEPAAPVAAAPAEPAAEPAAPVAATPAEPAAEPAAPVAATPAAPAAPVAAATPAAPVASSPAEPAAPVAAATPAGSAASSLDAARASIARGSGSPPTNPKDTLIQQGRELFGQGRTFDAAQQFFKVLQEDPANPEARRLGYLACEFIAIEQMQTLLPPPAATP